MSVKLERPVAAIRSKAQREGISLKPINRSPYNLARNEEEFASLRGRVASRCRAPRGDAGCDRR